MWEYTDKVKEHFLNPHNVGEIENPTPNSKLSVVPVPLHPPRL